MGNYVHFCCEITAENGETLHASYCVTKHLFADGDACDAVYGIKCTAQNCGKIYCQSHVADISPSSEFVCSLAQKLCACKALPIHLHDLASDAIA